MTERNKRFRYETRDVEIITNQCSGCMFNLNNYLECKKYKRIPRGTRGWKVRCSYREEKRIIREKHITVSNK